MIGTFALIEVLLPLPTKLCSKHVYRTRARYTVHSSIDYLVALYFMLQSLYFSSCAILKPHVAVSS